MTLDCEPFGFFQPRVITLHSYYLTSLVNLSFYGLTFHPIFLSFSLFFAAYHFGGFPSVGWSCVLKVLRYGSSVPQTPVSLIGLHVLHTTFCYKIHCQTMMPSFVGSFLVILLANLQPLLSECDRGST